MADRGFRYPTASLPGRALESLVRSSGVARVRRRVMSSIPFPALASDVTDALYLNWFVETEGLRRHLPRGVEVWDRAGLTVLTVLTYRHGCFGPSALGPIRRICPSPVQSNWRLYVRSIGGEDPSQPTVLFLANVLDSPIYAIGSRMLSDSLQADLPRAMRYERIEGDVTVRIVPGRSNAPDLAIAMRRGSGGVASEAFRSAFGGLDAAIRWICLQDAAITVVPGLSKLAAGEISISMDLDQAIPLDTVPGTFVSRYLAPIVAGRDPFGFMLPKVGFRVVGERLLAVPATRSATSPPERS